MSAKSAASPTSRLRTRTSRAFFARSLYHSQIDDSASPARSVSASDSVRHWHSLWRSLLLRFDLEDQAHNILNTCRRHRAPNAFGALAPRVRSRHSYAPLVGSVIVRPPHSP